MNDSTSLFPAASPEWMQWLSRAPHDIYQTPAYHLLAEERGEGAAYLIVHRRGDRFVAWPYLLRRIEREAPGPDLYDVASVYGYAGPVFRGCSPSDSFLRDAWSAITEIWRQQNAVTAFTRFHPLLGNAEYVAAMLAENGSAYDPDVAGELTTRGHTVSISLTESAAETFQNYKRNFRQQISRCRRLGLRSSIDKEWEFIREFSEVYHQTMVRNQAANYYFFDVDYFERLKNLLGSNAFLSVVHAGDQIVSGCAVLAYDNLLHLHLGGTRSDYLALSPFKLLIDDLGCWGRGHGYEAIHMGGGRGSSDGDVLFRFKSGFSGRSHVFHTGKWIIDPSNYSLLCEEKRRYALDLGLECSDPEYFPYYRAPWTASQMRLTHSCDPS